MNGSACESEVCRDQRLPCPELAFFSAHTQLLATSRSQLARQGTWADTAERALGGARLEGARAPVVMGALPFDSVAEGAFSLVRDCLSGDAARNAALQHPAARDLLTSGRAVERPLRAEYERAVGHALAAIDAGRLEKIVLARAVDYSLVVQPCRGALLSRLLSLSSSANVFLFRLAPGGTAGITLIGASPEVLISKRGRSVYSHPLAGSTPRAADPALDRARAEALLGCDKNRREHAFVVDAIASALAPWCSDLHVPPQPALVSTPKVWHLGTSIRGTLRDGDVSSLSLAELLHPTPAVCGAPRELARTCIRDLEGFERGFYAGAVGYCDAAGDGEWVVAIRCAALSERALRLYAGAGIVAGAKPTLELEETSVKLSTMLDALGLGRWEQVA